LLAAAALLAAPATDAMATTGTGGMSASSLPSALMQPPRRAAVLSPTGRAWAPRPAPRAVRRVIAAGNRIVALPYRYGGGHASFDDTAYDCSGAVSYALHGGGLLAAPLDSVAFASWGVPGRGRWITVYTNPSHAFLVVAGLRLDTSGTGGNGPRWQTARRSAMAFAARHPAGL
jgi:hypothetical protein